MNEPAVAAAQSRQSNDDEPPELTEQEAEFQRLKLSQFERLVFDSNNPCFKNWTHGEQT